MKHFAGLRSWFFCLSAAVLAASSFVAIEVGLEHFSPTTLVLGRFLVAVLVLAAIAFAKTRRPSSWSIRTSDGFRLLGMGLTGAVGYNALLTAGQQLVDPFVASLLVNTVPIWVYLLAVAGREERLGWGTATGGLIGLVGATLAGASAGGVEATWLGCAALLGAAFCQAVYFVLLKSVAGRLGAERASLLTVGVGTLLLLPLFPALLEEVSGAGWRPLVAVLYLGSLPGAVGVLFWAMAMRFNRATATASALFLVPPLAALFAWLVLAARPSLLSMAGGGLALIGVRLVIRGRSGGETERATPAPPSPVCARSQGGHCGQPGL